MKKITLVKIANISLGLFTLNSLCACANYENIQVDSVDIPKIIFQLGIGICGVVLSESMNSDRKNNDTVIGKKINRRF